MPRPFRQFKCATLSPTATYKNVFGQFSQQVMAGVDPVLQRIAFRLGRPNGDIRADVRQELISRQDKVELRTIQTSVFG